MQTYWTAPFFLTKKRYILPIGGRNEFNRTLCKMLQKAVAKQNPNEYEPWQKALMCA